MDLLSTFFVIRIYYPLIVVCDKRLPQCFPDDPLASVESYFVCSKMKKTKHPLRCASFLCAIALISAEYTLQRFVAFKQTGAHIVCQYTARWLVRTKSVSHRIVASAEITVVTVRGATSFVRTQPTLRPLPRRV